MIVNKQDTSICMDFSLVVLGTNNATRIITSPSFPPVTIGLIIIIISKFTKEKHVLQRLMAAPSE